MGEYDDMNTSSMARKAAKPQAYHSSLSEHFEGKLPLFVNRWKEGFELREHDHAYIEIVYVMAGVGYHYVGNQTERISKGSLYILPVGTAHILRPRDASGSNSLLVYNLCIRPDLIDDLKIWLSHYGESGEILSTLSSEPGSYFALLDQGMRLGPYFEQLHQEYTDKQQGFETIMLGIAIQLIVKMSRLLQTMTTIHGKANTAVQDSRLQQLLLFIQSHIGEPLTVEQLAARHGISKRHFIRLFNNLTGMGFSEYLQHKRVETACQQLLETNYKLTHIANNVGYRDIAHFRTLFKKVIGVTPKEYRRQHTRMIVAEDAVTLD